MQKYEKIRKKAIKTKEDSRIKFIFSETNKLLETSSDEVEHYVKNNDINDLKDHQKKADYSMLYAAYFFSIEKDEAVEKYIQIATNELKSLGENEQINVIYALFGLEYLKYQEYKKHIRYFEILRQNYTDTKDKLKLASTLNDLTISYRNLGDFSQALKCTKQAIRICKSINSDLIIFSYNNLATIYFRLNKLDKALDYYLQALKLLEKDNEAFIASQLYNNIANVYNNLKDFENALEYYTMALDLERKKKDIPAEAVVLNNIGLVHNRMKNEEEAIKFFKLSIQICEQQNIRKTLAHNLCNLGMVYVKLKRINEALEVLLKAEKIMKEADNPFVLTNILKELGDALLQNNDFLNAEKKLQKAAELAFNNGYRDQLIEINEILIELYKLNGNKQKQIEILSKQVQLIDEHYKNDYTTRLAEIQTLYDLETKEKEKEIFRLKAVELEKKNQQINIQKKQLEKTLDQLRKSEISYEYVSNQLKGNIGTKIVGESDQIKNINKLINTVAKSSTSVLITGETGTGKELVARAIHDLSDRKNQNFCAVNVAAIPDTLFESEFFGHTKNAFTGAKSNKAGWFEIANQGTLFLDEFGSLNLDLQTIFLRTLEEKKIIPVGSNKEIPVDFRLISATNNDLTELIENKKFRLDLYHRLSVFIINIPPLRERIEDIPLLTEHFVRNFSLAMKKKVNRVEKQVFKALQSYSFPGNVRELKNMIERAMILSRSSTLKLDCFNIPSITHKNDEIVPLAELERSMVLKALRSTGFHQKNAAELLNITPKSLKRRMIKFNIKREK